MYKLTITPYWNTELPADSIDGSKYRLYYKLSYNRKNTKLKSQFKGYLTKEEFNLINDAEDVQWEIALLKRIMEIETNNYEDKLSSFKGFSDKIRIHLSRVDKVYKAYGLRLIEQQLLNGVELMSDKELKIYNELVKLLPVETYLSKKGNYYPIVYKNPHTYCLLIFGYLSQFEITEEDKILNEVKENLTYYMEGLNAIEEFYKSKFLRKKKDALIIHWMSYEMKSQFAQYLNKKYANEPQSEEIQWYTLTPNYDIKLTSKSAVDIITRIDLGLMHSGEFLREIAIPNTARNK